MTVSKKRPKFILFPSDLGKNSYQIRKNKLALSGKAVSYNMYEQLDQIKSYNEIMTMSHDEGKRYIEAIKAKHPVKHLMNHWGVSSYLVYNKMFKQFNVDVQPSNRALSRVKPNMQNTNPIVIKTQKLEQPVNGFAINLNGDFIGSEISKRITNILLILNIDDDYKINLRIIDVDPLSKIKSSIEHKGIASGKEIQDQIQNINILPENKYNIEFSIQEE